MIIAAISITALHSMYAAEVPPTSVAKNGEARQLAQILKAKFIFVIGTANEHN
jgi:hypothetical protein